jgi:tetratricopeptide (TPR) repeat protein
MALAIGAWLPLALALTTIFRVEYLSRQATPESLTQAIALSPRNAELHSRLGRTLLLSPEVDSAQAEQHLSRAVSLDPRNGDYWTDLALAREARGDDAGMWAALEKARAAEPRTPLIRWHAMNFLLRRGDVPRALDEAAGLLRLAPEYTSRVVPVLSNAAPMDKIIAAAVPDDSRVLCELMMVVSRARARDGAAAAWQRVLRAGGDYRNTVCVQHFLDSIIVSGDAELGQRVWREAIARGWFDLDAEAARDPLYNADFRQPIHNFGFDWRVIPAAEASTWIEAQGPEQGQQSLCVEFSEDARAEYNGVRRYIPVEPQTEYLFHGFVRSDRLVSSSGAYLQVDEVIPPGAGVTALASGRSDTWSGTNHWKQIAFRVSTGPRTQLLALQLRRPGALASDANASGRTCISSIEWRAIGPAGATNLAGLRPTARGAAVEKSGGAR